MTEKPWLGIGCQLLGIYWIIEAALELPTILLAAGTVTTPYVSKWLYVAAPAAQALIAAVAGTALWVWSSRTTSVGDSAYPEHDVGVVMPPALQLFGVFTLVSGCRALGGLARRFSYRQPWPTEWGEILSAAIGIGLGLLLIMRARRIAAVLARYRGTSA